jgi:hypothetical protein
MLSRLKVGAAVALGAATVLAGPTSPALAGGAPVRFAASTGTDAVTPKTVTARCPTGSLFATGARIVGGGGAVVLTAIIPHAASDSVTVTAAARPWYQGAWSLTAFAVCDRSVSPPGVISAAAQGSGSVTATCPGGSRLTGAGFRLDGAVDHLGVREVAIGPGLREVRVGVGGTGLPTGLTAYGLCKPPTGPDGVLVTNPGAVNGDWPKATAVGDATMDTRVYGVGASVTGPADAFLTALVPNVNLNLAMAEAARGGPPATGAARLSAADDGDADGSLSVSGVFIGTFH